MVFQANGLRDAFEGQGEARARPAGQERDRMTSGAFDPFDLPTGFDPLGSDVPPPPRRQRGAPAPVPGAGAGGRLDHLLGPSGPPTAVAGQRQSPNDTATRLQRLDDEVAKLAARLDGLHATLTQCLDQQLTRLARAMTTQHGGVGERGSMGTALSPFLPFCVVETVAMVMGGSRRP